MFNRRVLDFLDHINVNINSYGAPEVVGRLTGTTASYDNTCDTWSLGTAVLVFVPADTNRNNPLHDAVREKAVSCVHRR